MSNPFLKRATRQKTQPKAYWKARKQEKRTAKQIGGYRVSGSGSGRQKGDARKRGVVRVENKGTQASSFRVTRDMLDKIANVCIGNEEIPVVQIDFLDQIGNPIDSYAVIPWSDLVKLLEAYNEGTSKDS